MPPGVAADGVGSRVPRIAPVVRLSKVWAPARGLPRGLGTTSPPHSLMEGRALPHASPRAPSQGPPVPITARTRLAPTQLLSIRALLGNCFSLTFFQGSF